ncbi:MAG TPA: histidinol dehydrogenase, partial [Gammaproteobacteria bacterium]|nr:histidinol dehydrogenase [Gammaproteobacteria bacterium]
VFLGRYAPESVGDYASGTNHVLPTYGYARNHSGLSLKDFMLQISVQELTASGLAQLGPTVEVLAHIEGLQAHALAVSLRLQEINNDR